MDVPHGHPSFPAELQPQLDAIIELCYRDCSHESDPLTAVNAVTCQLPTRIQAVNSHVQRIVSDSDIRTSPLRWVLLGRLVPHLNWHFRVRPRVIFSQDAEDAQAVVEVVRSIVAAVTTLVRTMSLEDEENYKLSAFRILTMETEDDVEMAARFEFLDLISERVIACRPVNQRWVVEVNGAHVQRARYSKPKQQDDPDAACMICLLPLFAFNEDGSAPISDGHVHRHVFHDHCAQQCFIFNRENLCPSCRHDSSGILFQNNADALQHEVVNGIAQWSKAMITTMISVQCRLHCA
jgi:hypothetical protein